MELYDIYRDLTNAGKEAYTYSDYRVFRNEVDVDDNTETVMYDYTIEINGSLVRDEMTLEDVIDFFDDLGDEMLSDDEDEIVGENND